MSAIGRGTTTEYPGGDTESSPFESQSNGSVTYPMESEDFAEFVERLTKSNWFCEVAEA